MVWGDNFYSPIQKELNDLVVVVRGFSKVLGAQSWRVGYVVSTPSMIDELMRVADPIYICVSWLQHALAKYITEENPGEDFPTHKKKVGDLIQRNWKVISAAMQDAFQWEPIPPSGTMYGMFRHKEASDMEAVIKALQKGVGICPGNMFFKNYPENTGLVRIHCGVSEAKADDITKRLRS
jgi:aspartate/methionine/tyrosine aminotransferase